MTTLALLKAEIADDLDRTDLTASIASEIPRSIAYYQNTRFYFNETRACLVSTADDQRLYSDEDVVGIAYSIVLDENGDIVEDTDGNIVLFPEVSEAVTVGVSVTDMITVDLVIHEDDGTELERMSPFDWERLTASGTTKGKPTNWCFYGGSFGLYPIPDDEYAIRFIGHAKIAAPATNGETNNVWMIYAFNLIRARTCAQLSLRKLRDRELFQSHSLAEAVELQRLLSETTGKVSTGFVTPTEF